MKLKQNSRFEKLSNIVLICLSRWFSYDVILLFVSLFIATWYTNNWSCYFEKEDPICASEVSAIFNDIDISIIWLDIFSYILSLIHIILDTGGHMYAVVTDTKNKGRYQK